MKLTNLSAVLFAGLLVMPLSAESLWQKANPAPASLFLSWNPDVPYGGNDGALWQGRGFNLRLQGGVEASWEGWSFRLYPELDASQDLAYTMLRGPGDYGWGLDRVQSYDQGGFVHFDWGLTEVRYTRGPVTIGLGTDPLILGAASENHVLLSNNAGGFPHLEFGTPGAVETPWGAIEARLLWGGLFNSTQYLAQDGGQPTDWRFFHALVVGYSPPFWPEVTLGAGRIFQSPWETLSLFKTFQSLVDTVWKRDRGLWSGGNTGQEDDVDQLIAIYLDYFDPVQDLRIYAELARNDHASGLDDFLLQPDHSLGYVFGVRKGVALAPPWGLDFAYEQADLGLNYGTIVRPTGSWYRHGPNPEGYTLGGQLLGAAIGQGSNSNFGEVGLSYGEHRVFGAVERVAKDVDYWVVATHPANFHNADVSVAVTLGGQTRWDEITYRVSGSWIKEYNRYWVQGNYEKTWNFTLEVIWRVP